MRAFTSIGFSCTPRRWSWSFVRDDTIFVFPEVRPHGFDVFHLFRNAKVHGIDGELWNALIKEENDEDDPAPAA